MSIFSTVNYTPRQHCILASWEENFGFCMTRSRFDTSSVDLLSFSFFTLTRYLTDTFCLNVQHHIFLIQHLQVVCILRLHSVCGRPTTIFYSAFKELSRSLIRDTPNNGENFKSISSTSKPCCKLAGWGD